MSAIIRAQNFTPSLDLARRKGRLVYELGAYARGAPLALGGKTFSSGEEHEVNVALATELGETPFRAQVYRSHEKILYLLATIGYSFELGNTTISLLVNVRSNAETAVPSWFFMRPEGNHNRLFVDINLDDLSYVAEKHTSPVFASARRTHTPEQLLAAVVFLETVKEYAKAQIHQHLARQGLCAPSSLSYLVPSAFALALHPFTFERALALAPNKDRLLAGMNLRTVREAASLGDAFLHSYASTTLRELCSRVGIDLCAIVNNHVLDMLSEEILGKPLYVDHFLKV